MSQLLRIVLLHTHLPGVVELQLDEHTNICGTNASGKTTLQRLVPVFYGEQPNRVVPKTRKKFDEFYLPYANSYLIYEYRRENGSVCQVVLTKRSEGGVDYRFVDAPYQADLYLVENTDGAKALSYSDWAANLRARSIDMSAKISATSEYRSIIQNDANALRGNNSDSVKLRRLAATFSLAGSNHKLRHIEKLVSAVHAKESKMDTLKAMLAAIFEEDGVDIPTTKVKNTKAREWIQQMRQSMRLEKLQQDFEKIKNLALHLDEEEAKLAAFLPLLQDDENTQKRTKADAEQQSSMLKAELASAKERFTQKQVELTTRIASAQATFTEATLHLEQLQKRYDEFESKDMPKLLRDTDALPLWRETLQELTEQYQLMTEQHGDLERQLELQKTKLVEAFNRLSEKNREKAKQIQQQKDKTRDLQNEKLASLEQAFQTRLQQTQQQFMQQSAQLSSAIAVIQSQLKVSPLSEQEHEEMRLLDKRVEQAQEQAQMQARQVQQLHKQYQDAKNTRDNADAQLELCRKNHHQSEFNIAQLKKQLTPEKGSLRQFLRQNVEGWEQKLGKVIDESLLERTDLQPYFTGASENVFGLKLDLSAIETPSYAQDEAAILIKMLQAEQELEKAVANKIQAEKQLKECYDKAEIIKAQADEASRLYAQFEQNIDYAKDARNRLDAKHRTLTAERQSALKNDLSAKEKQLEKLKLNQLSELQAQKEDHNSQKLELKADWQSALQEFDDQINELDRQLRQKQEDDKERIKELQHAFSEELSKKGIDPSRISALKQKQAQLRDDIKKTESQKDELSAWQRFMSVDWQQMRPTFLAQENQSKQQERDIKKALEQLKTEHNALQKNLEQQKQQQQEKIEQAEQLLIVLKQLLAKISALNLIGVVPAAIAYTADCTERLQRANEALEERAKLDNTLKYALEQFESLLNKDAGTEFLDRLEHEKRKLPEFAGKRRLLPILANLLQILQDAQQQLLEMGENIGGDLQKFFTVFNDINRKITAQSRRLSEAVADDLDLDGIDKSEVKILSTIDELGFWQPLKNFAKLYDEWRLSGKALPSEQYLNALADVVELLRSDEQYSIENLLRLELHLSEGGSDLVIKNDRQLLESSSHGMAYLILCKYLLAFTRLLRGSANVSIHWPIDEIGTLAYHNVEKLFKACSSNNIIVVGAFPNPESDVLMLFKHRYLIEPSQHDPSVRQLKRIQPKVSRLTERLASVHKEAN